jgi:hypothetical protein
MEFLTIAICVLNDKQVRIFLYQCAPIRSAAQPIEAGDIRCAKAAPE